MQGTGEDRDFFFVWAEVISSSTASCIVPCLLTAPGCAVSAVQAGPGAAAYLSTASPACESGWA